MKLAIAIIAISLAVIVVALLGCTQTAFDTGFRNLTAAQCDNQQATLANLPLTLLTPAQAGQILGSVCATLFGTSPAPTPAPGMGPVIPGPVAK